MNLIDTNILLDSPEILEQEGCAISTRVIDELDGLKNSENRKTAFKARRASSFILKRAPRILFIDKVNLKLSVDDNLVKIAKKQGFTIVTNDTNLQIKCSYNGVCWMKYKGVDRAYSGVTYHYLWLDDNGYNPELEEIMKTMKPPFEMSENEFLIVKNLNSKIEVRRGIEDEVDYEVVVSLQYKGGKLVFLNEKLQVRNSRNKIRPRNVEQTCLFNLLNNKEVTIVSATGNFGTGKSFLLINYALEQLEREEIGKIIYVPNNSFNENSREIGILPGALLEKEIIHMGTLVDIVGNMRTETMVEREQIEVIPISIMRGRSFTDSIIIVNEAQNLTEDHVKLLVARCGEGTRIFFDGDVKQSDSDVFRNRNGLRLLSNLHKSEHFGKIFGTVKLQDIERGITAQASAYLDNL